MELLGAVCSAFISSMVGQSLNVLSIRVAQLLCGSRVCSWSTFGERMFRWKQRRQPLLLWKREVAVSTYTVTHYTGCCLDAVMLDMDTMRNR